MAYQAPVRKIIWVNLTFFIVTGLIGLIGTPIYASHYGVSSFEIAFTLFFVVATGMAITAGYHRLFSHATYQAHPVIQFLYLFFGAAAFEQSAMDWSAQHRDHHRYVDTDRDPYSIEKGFFYAHIGWLIFWKHHIPYENVPDLQKNPMVVHQHRNYYLWAIGSGIIFPVVVGAMAGHALGAFILTVCLRLAVVHHATFCINSVCHVFGKSTYDPHSSARDHWLVAFLTNGEGYHNFHHRFPSDYRNAIRWYQWDPSKWLIALLAKAGLAWNLKKVSKFRIWEARLAAENTVLCEQLKDSKKAQSSAPESFQAMLQDRYKRLAQGLKAWEKVSREYQELMAGHLRPSRELLMQTLHNIKDAQRNFKSERRHWLRFIRTESPMAFLCFTGLFLLM